MSGEPIGTREELLSFLKGRKIMEVECLVPDLAGMPRGKILPVEKFVAGLEGRGMRVPENGFSDERYGVLTRMKSRIRVVIYS